MANLLNFFDKFLVENVKIEYKSSSVHVYF